MADVHRTLQSFARYMRRAFVSPEIIGVHFAAKFSELARVRRDAADRRRFFWRRVTSGCCIFTRFTPRADLGARGAFAILV